jgi:hypothetical protein
MPELPRPSFPVEEYFDDPYLSFSTDQVLVVDSGFRAVAIAHRIQRTIY